MFGANGAARAETSAAGRASQGSSIDGSSEARIGAGMEAARRELIETGALMGKIVSGTAADLTQDAVRMLERQSCKIAVVGQIKAGKSSFVNALVRRPGLLPTDINPWTTAVTNLHFGQAGPDGAEAVFSFFSEGEWEQLVEGAGKLRELTERLVPGFKSSLLRQQVLTLRARATTRLGEQYPDLMGRAHSYSRFDGEMLQQYVCSGIPDPDSPVGRYSEITRSADIYLGSGPFALPVTIMDTPGTNDPFLVRDEITRAALDRADITLVLLTAHQPLSDADVSLLRILRGLNKERIIVVVNRIDELADVARDTRTILAFVRDKLAQELPGSHIPVVPGSARWAIAALASPAGPDLDAPALQRVLAYCRDANLLDASDVLKAPSAEIVRSLHRAAVLAASGLPKLYAALDAMIPESRCGYVIREFCRCFTEMAQASLLAAKDARAAHAGADWSALTADDPARLTLERLREEAAALGDAVALVRGMAADFEQQMQEVVARSSAELDTRLRDLVDAHAENERNALIMRLRVGQKVRAWTCDSASLNRDLADEFMLFFGAAERRLSEVSASMISGLRDLATLLGPSLEPQSAPGLSRRLVAPPNPGALGKRVVLDLDDSWWSQLWKTKPAPEERGDAIESLVRGVYYPLIDDLKAAFDRTIQGYADTRVRWSSEICGTIARTLASRQEQLDDYCSRAGGGAPAGAEPPRDQELRALDTKIAEGEGLLRRLRVLESRIDGLAA